MLNNLLIIDIETVPIVENFNQLNENWQSLWIDKVSKHLPEQTNEETWKMKGGIMAEFGKIVCISTGYFFEDVNRNQCLKIKSIYGDDEKDLLQRFLDLCNKFYKHNKNFCFSGHNIKEFDIPYICRRILINHLALPEYLWLHDRKPWEVKMLDTLNWWRFGDNKNYTSLHLLANTLGIETSKDDIDGSMVKDVYYKEKNLPRIVNYCQKDIKVVANIILRYQNLPLLNNEFVIVVE
jgi:hypothetical protein